MEWKLILWIISFLIFWGYAAWYLSKHKADVSWSNTFYTLNEEKKDKGYLLLGALWGTSFPLMPLVAEKTPFMLIPLGLIVLIGAAVAFKDDKSTYKAHMFGSYGSVITALLIFGVIYGLWYVSISLALFILYIHFKWKPYYEIKLIESIVIFAGHIIVLLKDVL